MLLLVSRIGGVRQPGSSAHAVSLGASAEDEETRDALSGDAARFSGFNATIFRHAERQLR
jgi:hypothetical protein